MLPKAKVTSNAYREGFSRDDILYENLLDRLGGREMLELMIGAADFDHIYYNRQGLKFTFKASPNDRVSLAQFVPMATGSSSDSYQIVFSVEVFSGRGFKIAKPYHSVTLTHPFHLAYVFETVTKLALTFP
jgi:hypothetical protein